jgi:5,6-dimethylbenzimidazole synthase
VTERSSEPPVFGAGFRAELAELFRWRRDVRRFRPEPLAPGLLDDLLDQASLAPSVGYSQPWRFVSVESPERRRAVRDIFLRCNADALAGYKTERAKLYATLKLEGMDEAPTHLAVFVDEGTKAGHGLGRRTMPEALRYSVVTAIHTLWLVARAWNVGLGWVTILDPIEVERALDAEPGWALVGYLCLGYPQDPSAEPELLRAGWQTPDPEARRLRHR